MLTRLCDSVSGRYRTAENSLLTKHVVAAGKFAKDAGSTPAASTIFYWESWMDLCQSIVGSPKSFQRRAAYLSSERNKTPCSLCELGIDNGGKRVGRRLLAKDDLFFDSLW
jgi:hypothetical protein